MDRGALCLGVEGLASNRDGSSEGASSVSMTGEEMERWGRDTYDCATWSASIGIYLVGRLRRNYYVLGSAFILG